MGNASGPRSTNACRSARKRAEARFFEPLDLDCELADLDLELGHFLVVGLGLLLDGLGFREEIGKVVEGLPFPPMELAGRDLVLSRNLRDRFLSFSISSTPWALNVAFPRTVGSLPSVEKADVTKDTQQYPMTERSTL